MKLEKLTVNQAIKEVNLSVNDFDFTIKVLGCLKKAQKSL